MKKRLVSLLILVIYSLVLIKVMVFKDVPTINIGVVRFDFAGTNGDNPPNFIPFMTIVPYVLGQKGILIGGLNLLGNIVFLVPIGLLLPFLYNNINWKKSLVLGVIAGLAIEILQVVLRVGIFDIDDVILNALGVISGYGITILILHWLRAKKYKTIIASISIFVITITTLTTLFVGDILLQGKQSGRVRPAGNTVQTDTVTNDSINVNQVDLCGGTGGNGEITSVAADIITLKRREGDDLTINVTDETTVETATGGAAITDLKIGSRVTLVGDMNADGTFSAQTLVVCSD